MAVLQTNDISDTIWYISEDNKKNQRLIVDVPSEHPNVWQVSKVERVNTVGRTRIVLYQTEYDPHRDYIEKDENGNIVGMWADYYSSSINAEDSEIIKYKEYMMYGTKCNLSTNNNIIKIGGGYKTITAQILDKDNEDITKDYIISENYWHCYIDDEDVTDTLVKFIYQPDENVIKVKFTGDRSYLKKILKVTLEIDKIVGSVDFEIKSL